MLYPSVWRSWCDSITDLSEPKNLLGGKAFGLFSMSEDDVPVPPAVTITTEVCNSYLAGEVQLDTIIPQVISYLSDIAQENGFMPLFSVRSGARVSMPGMMDTILNVGLTADNLGEWMSRLGDRAALDCYRRLIQMYGSVVKGIDHSKFEKALLLVKVKYEVATDSELPPKALSDLIDKYHGIYQAATSEVFPETLEAQLYGAVGAVFKSWNNPRAITYRELNGYESSWGTSATVQMMVFGNLNEQSCSGVLFSRDPSTGECVMVGEYLPNAQGEDVVAGIRTPLPLKSMNEWNPSVLDDLLKVVTTLEAKYRDMQDVEFTVQSGALYILQTRSGKRTAQASFKIAYDMWKEGVITSEEAFSRVNAKMLSVMTKPSLAPGFATPPSFNGIAGGGGLVCGKAVFSSDEAVKSSHPCVLISKETTPDDIAGMNASVGIVTSTGGLTSHAAVVARGMDKACVVGCTNLAVTTHSAQYDGGVISPGDEVTIDGNTGSVWVSTPVPVVEGGLTTEASELLEELFDTHEPLIRTVGDYVGRAYLDSWVFGDHVAGYDSAGFASALDTLLSCCKEVFIDLNVKPMSDGDASIYNMFGPAGITDLYIHKTELVKGVISNPKHKEGLPKTYAILPVGAVLSKAMKEAGIEAVPEATTLGELLNCTSLYKPSPTLMDTVFKDAKVFEEFMQVLKDAGRPIELMPVPRTSMEFLFHTLS